MAFDTLATARALKEAGLDERQAEAIAEAIRLRQGNLARHFNIETLKAEMKVELYKVALAVVAANAAITFGLLRFFNS